VLGLGDATDADGWPLGLLTQLAPTRAATMMAALPPVDRRCQNAEIPLRAVGSPPSRPGGEALPEPDDGSGAFGFVLDTDVYEMPVPGRPTVFRTLP
jgi:hypothetical protein